MTGPFCYKDIVHAIKELFASVQCELIFIFTEAQYTPSQDREVTRRKIANGVTELWFYLRSELNKAADRLRAAGGGAGDAVLANLKSVLEDGADMQRYIIRRRASILQLVTPLTSHLPIRARNPVGCIES